MVRKGIKNGLVCEIDSNVDRFFALYSDNVLRHGTPALPKRFFETLMKVFGQDCEVMTITSPEGKLLSTVLTFYFRDEVLPYYAGDDLAARELAANDFKYWELMRRACARGYKIFDYGRSKVGTGPYSFKKNWGFEPQPLSYEYRLYKRDEVPQNNPLNPKYRAFIAMWRRLPLAWPTRSGRTSSVISGERGGRRPHPLLYLVHRIPFPPNKGDKVRSFNILRQLAGGTGCSSAPSSIIRTTSSTSAARRVVRGEPCGPPRSAPAGSPACAASPARPSACLITAMPASPPGWQVVAREGIREAVAFSGPMAQYLDVPGLPGG
jgi:hypothetical protein